MCTCWTILLLLVFDMWMRLSFFLFVLLHSNGFDMLQVHALWSIVLVCLCCGIYNVGDFRSQLDWDFPDSIVAFVCAGFPVTDDSRAAGLLRLIMDVLCVCVSAHTYHIRNHIISRDLLRRVLVLTQSVHKHLALSKCQNLESHV